MDRPGQQNPFDCLSDEDRERIEALEQCENLDFIKAVDILCLEPSNDFKYADFSGMNFEGKELSHFDFSGAKLVNCNFENSTLPKGVVRILDRVEGYDSKAQGRFLKSLAKISANGNISEAKNLRTQATRFIKFSSESAAPLNNIVKKNLHERFVALDGVAELNLTRGMASFLGFGLPPIVDFQIDLSESDTEVFETLESLAAIIEDLSDIVDATLEVWDLNALIDLTWSPSLSHSKR
ncbi:pentapeptide repeat-containing protein [uncultured Roseobacter sp.]|uniref:pentapeptide repeat-containing protein n=1 Tax=uncultured Roseobacter sp. TaxID=114847 RepID=UPI00260AB688|nr:pentapeptide repeat-containing protein [uncultured Roseobacter sp.]